MAISQALCTSFKQELLQGIHNFTNGSGGGTTTSTGSGNTFKIALFTSSASLGAGTTAYADSNQASGTGYTTGGNARDAWYKRTVVCSYGLRNCSRY